MSWLYTECVGVCACARGRVLDAIAGGGGVGISVLSSFHTLLLYRGRAFSCSDVRCPTLLVTRAMKSPKKWERKNHFFGHLRCLIETFKTKGL